ncbi:MAG TPA: polysaccharide deacetylase family protein [Thermoanaerobaculia bacterium]|nr:polysaccharide deacetylase family protein [Thermoanaerobaculia bacterium]
MAERGGVPRDGGGASYRPPPLLAASLALHAAGALALAAAPRHWRAIAGVLVADHVVLAAASLWPRGTSMGANLSRLPAAAARRGEVALTFDDGPDPDVTPRVLDLLDRHGARATFFCIGERVRTHPEIAAEIARRGHRVENHTQTHPHLFACYPAPALRREILEAQESIVRANGHAPRLFRAPAGLRNPLLDWVLFRAGLRLVSWTRRGFDALERDPRRIAHRLLAGLTPGDVLLLHDGSTGRNRGSNGSNKGGNPVVLEVLPRLLDELAARELRSVPIAGALEAPG